MKGSSKEDLHRLSGKVPCRDAASARRAACKVPTARAVSAFGTRLPGGAGNFGPPLDRCRPGRTSSTMVRMRN
jgi:hypothetical protein